MPNLEDSCYLDDDEDVGAEADMNNLNIFILVSSILPTKIHKDHPVKQIIKDLHLSPQTRRMKKSVTGHGITQEEIKARLVNGYTQEEGIDYDEVFAPVARIEAIRLFIAYASFKDFVMYKMDAKSAFLYGKIEEEVYGCQPPGFEDPKFPDRVYKIRTLFIKMFKGDILLVQVYVNDIIFGSTRKEMCTEFEKMMHKKFQMSSAGELTFFLGLQVTQKVNGILSVKEQHPKVVFRCVVILGVLHKIVARIDAMTIKIDAQYKELQSRAKKPTPDLDEDDMPMSREEETKFMQTFCKTRFYNDYRDQDSNRDNWRSSKQNNYNRDNYRSNTDDKSYDLQKQFNDFMKSQQSTNAFVKDTFMDLKTQLETVAKNHQASIQNLKTKFDRLADKQSGRPSRSLPRNTQPNPKGSKSYQPPHSRNEHVNVVFTRSGKSYDPPVNPNDQQNNFETPINFKSDDEDKEPTPQPKLKNPKPIKETPLPKLYKPKIPYPQRLRKEKWKPNMENSST
ncbi:reverse transcriptase domain-containing protein [Tanacetum coccineum]